MNAHPISLGLALYLGATIFAWSRVDNVMRENPEDMARICRDSGMPDGIRNAALAISGWIIAMAWPYMLYLCVHDYLYPRYRLVRLNGAWMYVRWYIWERPLYYVRPRYRLTRLRLGRRFR